MSIEAFERLQENKREAILTAGIAEFSRKAYRDASTDSITRESGISKGLLFHYFGSKKEFYLYCLAKSLERLMQETEVAENEGSLNFYDILFTTMDQKMKLCMEYANETLFVNMASRESAREVQEGKQKIIRDNAMQTQGKSMKTMQSALATLKFKNPGNPKVMEGLYLYIHAVMNKYLLKYQAMPKEFFKDSEQIKAEIKEYLDLMLEGICK